MGCNQRDSGDDFRVNPVGYFILASDFRNFVSVSQGAFAFISILLPNLPDSGAIQG